MLSVKIQDKILEKPIIQGGMGVGISLGRLAGNVMKEGGMGVISAAHPGYHKPDFQNNSIKCNCEAIHEEVNKARKISDGKGLLAMNIMVAGTDYVTYVKESVKAKVDAIISGAGLPLELPILTKGSNVLLAPIVSSGKAMRLILKVWDKRYSTTPDFVVIEGSEAGGHLGFKKEDLLENKCQSLSEILKDVQNELKSYREKYSKTIPVFMAGGIFTGSDIAKYIQEGANGVQMGTRFIATEECDAHENFKNAIVNCTKEDLAIVKSPAGFPGRAIMNSFMKTVSLRENISMKNCFNCMKPCTPDSTPYCISNALIQSVKGNLDKGLIFAGSNAYRINKITTVHELIDELMKECKMKLEKTL